MSKKRVFRPNTTGKVRTGVNTHDAGINQRKRDKWIAMGGLSDDCMHEWERVSAVVTLCPLCGKIKVN